MWIFAITLVLRYRGSPCSRGPGWYFTKYKDTGYWLPPCCLHYLYHAHYMYMTLTNRLYVHCRCLYICLFIFLSSLLFFQCLFFPKHLNIFFSFPGSFVSEQKDTVFCSFCFRTKKFFYVSNKKKLFFVTTRAGQKYGLAHSLMTFEFYRRYQLQYSTLLYRLQTHKYLLAG